MTLQRYLDDIELQMMNAAPAIAASYRGHVDEEALAEAVEILCARYPVLRARIRPDDDGYLLYVPLDHHPRLVVLEGDQDTLFADVEGPWDPARAVVRVLLIRGESRGLVAIRIDHAIVDGRSLRTIFDELWRLYTDIVNDASFSAAPVNGLPVAPQRLLSERLGSGLGAPPRAAISRVSRMAAIQRRVRPVHGLVRLNEEETSQLISSARANQTSVHALVCGAVLVAQRAHGDAPSEPARMECLSPVDLRNRVVPPVGATETTNFLGLHKAEVIVPHDAHPVAVGHGIKRQLETAISRQQVPPIDLPRNRLSHLETTLEQRLARAQISNNGILPRKAQPAGLVITDFIVVQHFMRARYPIFSTYTHEGQLGVRCVYPCDLFSRDDVEQLVKRTTAELLVAADHRSSASV